MFNERFFLGLNNALDMHTSVAQKIRQMEPRDWKHSLAVGAYVGSILVTAAAGFVSAHVSEENKLQPSACQPGLNVALQRSLGPRLSVLETYSEMGIPLQLYIRSGNEYQMALRDERMMRNMYKADILMDYVDNKRSLTEGEFIRDFNQKCRMVLYYP